ncbi:hypothetical protein HQ576_04410 [bacterium]|nr:hypothetical protein [bacterium]
MAKKADRERTRPLTLEFLRDLGAFEGFVPPAGPFDPMGTWAHTYYLWLVQRWGSGGSLRLRRKPADDGGVHLDVDLTVAERTGCLRRARAALRCAADPLCTPRSWTLTTQILDLEGKPIAGTTVQEKGTLTKGQLTVAFDGRRRLERVPEPATSQWSLFDAVQRLPGPKTKPLAFAMLEEMDLVKPGQRLEFRETKTLELGGTTLRLRGYQQLGRGILPWQYWVDEQGRLLFAFSGIRAYIHDPKAEAKTMKAIDWARAKHKRRKTQ